MKKTLERLMSGATRLLVLALGLGLAEGAWAVTKPVAIWNGDFDTTPRNGFTLNANGNTIAADGSKITITDQGSGGVLVSTTVNNYKSLICIAGFKTNVCSLADSPFLMATQVNRDDGTDLTGVFLDSTGKFQGSWQKGSGLGSKNILYPVGEGIHYFADVFGQSTSYGTKAYLDGSTLVVENATLASSSGNTTGMTIGGAYDSRKLIGAEINYIAVYASTSDQHPSDYNELVKLFSPTALATVVSVVDNGTIVGGETVGINLSTASMTANLASGVSAAAVFVQENATLDVGESGCITINDGKGPLYIASGKTLTIDITDIAAPTATNPRVDIIRGVICDVSQVNISGTVPQDCEVRVTERGIFVTTAASPYGNTTSLSLGTDNGTTGTYLTTTAQTAFKNITLQQFYDYGLVPQVRVAGNSISGKGAMAYAYNRRVTRSADEVTAIRYEMQVYDGGYTKCIPIVLEKTDDGNGITARVVGPYYWNQANCYHLGDRFLQDKDSVEKADDNIIESTSNQPGYDTGSYNAYYLHVPGLYDNSHEVSGEETVGVEVPANNRALTLTGSGTVSVADVNLVANTISLSGSVTLTVKSLPTTSASIGDGCKLILDLGDVEIATAVTFSGAGKLEIKSGKLTLNGNNSDLSGDIIAKNGAKIKAGSASSFGQTGNVSATRRVIAEDGGTIDINGNAMGLTYRIAGDGEGSGALVNTGGELSTGKAQANGLELTANASVGGTADYGLLASSWNETRLNLNNFILTKKGNASFWLYNTTMSAGSASTGKVNISAGTVQFAKKAWVADDADYFTGTGTLELTNGCSDNNASTAFSKVTDFGGNLKITKFGSWPALTGANFPNRPSLEITTGVAMSSAYTSKSPLTIKNLKGDGTVDVTWSGGNNINRYIDILQTDNTEFRGNFPAGSSGRNACVTVRGEDDVSEANIKKLTLTARSTTAGSLTITNNVKVVFGSSAKWDSATVSVDKDGYFESQNASAVIASALNIGKGAHLIATAANCFQATTVNLPSEGTVYVDVSALNIADGSSATIISATTLTGGVNVDNLQATSGNYTFALDPENANAIKATNIGTCVWDGDSWSKADPSQYSDVIVNVAAGGTTLTLDADYSFDSITLSGSSGSLTIDANGHTLTVGDVIVPTGVTLVASSALTVNGSISGGGNLTLPDGVTFTCAEGTTWTIGGSLTVNSGAGLTVNGTLSLSKAGNSVFTGATIANGGTLGVNGYVYVSNPYNRVQIDGNLDISGAFDSQGDAVASSTGVVTVRGNGTLWLNYKLTNNGNVSMPNVTVSLCSARFSPQNGYKDIINNATVTLVPTDSDVGVNIGDLATYITGSGAIVFDVSTLSSLPTGTDKLTLFSTTTALDLTKFSVTGNSDYFLQQNAQDAETNPGAVTLQLHAAKASTGKYYDTLLDMYMDMNLYQMVLTILDGEGATYATTLAEYDPVYDDTTKELFLAAAQIGETKYPSLSAAFAAATDGQTVTLLKVSNEAGVALNDKSITFSENGKAFSGKLTGNGTITVSAAPSSTTWTSAMFAEGWTGEFVCGWTHSSGDFVAKNYGTANSTVTLTSMTAGQFSYDGQATGNYGGTLKIAGSVTTSNGYGNKTTWNWQSMTTFNKLILAEGGALNLVWNTGSEGVGFQVNTLYPRGGTITLANNGKTHLKIGSVNLTAEPALDMRIVQITPQGSHVYNNVPVENGLIGVTVTANDVTTESSKKLYFDTDGLYVAAASAVVGGNTKYFKTATAAVEGADADGTITVLVNTDTVTVNPGQSVVVSDGVTVGTISWGDEYETVTSVTGDGTTSYASTAKATTYYWKGPTGSAWATVGNWAVGAADGPTATRAVTSIDSVVFPSGTHTASLSTNNGTEKCGAITITGNVTLFRATDGWKQLHINGNISGSGTLTLNMVGLKADSGNGITVSCGFVGDGGTDNAFVAGKPFTFENAVVIKGSAGSYFKNENVEVTFNDSVEIEENAKLLANGAKISFGNEDIRLPNGAYLQPTSGSMTITENDIEWPSVINVPNFAIDAENGVVGSLLVENMTVNAVGDVQLGVGSTGSLTIGDGGVFKVGSSTGHKWLTFMTGSGKSEGNYITINEGGVLEACVLTFNSNSSPCPYAVNFNGGTLRTYCGQDYYKELIHDTAIQVNVLAGGAKVEVPATYTAKINPVMASRATEDGGLTKLGEGSLVVGSADYLPTYNGKTKVVAGALYLPSGYTPNLYASTQETTSDKDGYKKYVYVAAATFNNVSYDTVGEAVDAAEIAGGGMVTLIRNCEEDVVLPTGVSLKLGNNTLTGSVSTTVANSYVKLTDDTYSVDAYNVITINAPNATVTRTDTLETAIKDGDTITFTVAAGSGYVVSGVTANEAAVVPDAGVYSVTVTENTTIAVATVQNASISDVTFDYYASYTNADVTATVGCAGTYTLSVQGKDYVANAESAGTVTFENIDVSNTELGSGVAYTIMATGAATGGTSGTSDQKKGTVVDGSGWMLYNKTATGVGSWTDGNGAAVTPDYGDNDYASFSGTNIYAATGVSTGEVVTVTTNVKFGDVADPEMTIDANAQAAVRIGAGNVFQVYAGSTPDWVNVYNDELGSPEGDVQYGVTVKLNYTTQAYGVDITKEATTYPLTNATGGAAFPLAKAASAMQQVSYLGAGSFISLSGEYVSAGYTADVGTDGSATNVVVSSDFVNTYMGDVLASNVSAALSPTNTTKLVNGLNYFASYALGLDPTDEEEKPVVRVTTDEDGKFKVTLKKADGTTITPAANVALTLQIIAGADPENLTVTSAESTGTGAATEFTIDPSAMSGTVQYYKVQVNIGAK